MIRGKITTQCSISPAINCVKLRARILPSTIISLLFDFLRKISRDPVIFLSVGPSSLFVLARALQDEREDRAESNEFLRRSHETRLHVRPPTSNSGCERPLGRSLSFSSSFPFFLARSLASTLSSFSLLPRRLCSWCVHARARPVYSRARNQFTRRDLWCDRRTLNGA